LEEQITIGDSSRDPRDQSGEAGARLAKARYRRLTWR